MFFEETLMFLQWLDKFPEPQRFLIYFSVVFGMIGFCFLLWFIDKTIEKRKEAKLTK